MLVILHAIGPLAWRIFCSGARAHLGKIMVLWWEILTLRNGCNARTWQALHPCPAASGTCDNLLSLLKYCLTGLTFSLLCFDGELVATLVSILGFPPRFFFSLFYQVLGCNECVRNWPSLAFLSLMGKGKGEQSKKQKPKQ